MPSGFRYICFKYFNVANDAQACSGVGLLIFRTYKAGTAKTIIPLQLFKWLISK